jgi:hypothetical protein
VNHLLFRLPSTDADSVPQALRLVSGAGRVVRPGSVDDGGPWGLKWRGAPSALVGKTSWALITTGQRAYGWVRFCHAQNDPGNFFRDPPVTTGGWVLFTDRYVRFYDPIPVALPASLQGNRSRYLDPAEATLMGVPHAGGGEEVVWVHGPTMLLRRGCCP